MFPDKKHPNYGVFVKNYCEQLDKLDVKYDLAVMKKSDYKIFKLLNYFIFYTVSFFKTLFGKYDLVYVHYASYSSVAVLLADKIKPVKIFTNVHGSDVIPENKRQEKMQYYTKCILKRSEKIIVPSEYFKDVVSQKYEINKNKIFVSPSGGVNKKVFFSENRSDERECFTLGYVGRISHKKGWDVLIKACAKLNFKYSLMIVGDGIEKARMLDMIEEYNIQNCVNIKSFLSQEELRKVYNEMDIFIFPTEREGESLGLVALEAMACGTPVIASNYAAPGKYVVDGYNGFKFEVGNEYDLAEKICQFKFLTEKEKKDLIEGAKETAALFSEENTLQSMKSVLWSKVE